MNKSLNWFYNLSIFGIPLLLMGAMVLLVQSSFFLSNPSTLSIGITLDMVLTAPFVYFLLIRKRDIPKTTVVPLFILGIVIASFILPKENQFLLSQIKHWVLPVVEIGVLGFTFFKIRQTIQRYKQEKSQSVDFFTALKQFAPQIVPKKVSPLFVSEIAVIYYSFLAWKKKELKENEFSYHLKSGSTALFMVFIFMILIETTAIHLLLHHYYPIAAWILLFLSLYTVIQVFGIMRSLRHRPIIVEEDALKLCYGMFAETTVPFDQIEKVEILRRSLKDDEKEIVRFSLLKGAEKPNILLQVKEERTVEKIYGLKKNYRTLVFYVDDKEHFLEILQQKIAVETA